MNNYILKKPYMYTFFIPKLLFFCRKQNYLFMYTGRYSELQPVTSKECNVYTHEGYNVKTI